jgi:hypothetical protein
MKKIILSVIVLSVFLFSSCKKDTVNEEAIFDPQNKESEQITQKYQQLVAKAEFIFDRQNYLVELYYQEKGSDEMIKTPSFNDIPANKVQAFYNLIRYSNGQLMYVNEFPLTEPRNWDIIYESYFDENGKIVVFSRLCTFYNSKCADLVSEKSEYFYNKEFKLIKKTYQIVDGNEKPLHYQDCVFPYRFPYDIYKNADEWLKKHPIK